MSNFSLGVLFSAFTAGLLSFFSPCIFPLLPVYLGYFSTNEEAGEYSPYQQMGIKLLKTLFFVAGLSIVFFLLGFGAGALGNILSSATFSIACGIIVLIFGLHYAELIQIPVLLKQKQFYPQITGNGYLSVFLLGLAFSFGWTPCVGPVLASVLSLTAQNGGALTGGWLLLIYSLGLSIPFLVLSIGASVLYTKIKKLNRYLPQIKLIGGLLIAVMGLWMIFSQVQTLEKAAQVNTGSALISQETVDTGEDFTLKSINGDTVRLSDYRGKPVCVKFWGTWCPSCMAGLESFAELSEELNGTGNVEVLSIVAPGFHSEMDTEDFISWAHAQELNFPILLDEGAVINQQFDLQAYPTYLFFDSKGTLADTHLGDIPEEELKNKLAGLNN